MKNTSTIVFVHGLFMNPSSWQPWMDYFTEKGYSCYAPAYPYHEGQVADLKANPNAALGQLTLSKVLAHYEQYIATLPQKPILIGHSMGGLLTQLLIQRKCGIGGICIDSAPPKGVFSFKWSFLKANLPTINPLKGDTICYPDVNWFHYAFCNVLSLEETQVIYDRYVVPESRNIPRSSTGHSGKIDFSKAHAPLLFIAGEKDNIIPASLNLSNYKAYTDLNSSRDFKVFPNRSHIICNQTGWEEVASYCWEWMKTKQ